MPDIPDKLTFKYVYPENLRDLYINGCWGGVTPRKEIYMHLFSERHPIPKSVTHSVDKKTMALGKEIDKEEGGNVVRLIQTSVAMDISTAIAVRDWLDDKIKAVQKMNEEEVKHGPAN
jgi:hypothetical protein